MSGRRGQGEGSIFYRKDRKRWMAQVTLQNGKQRSRSARTRAEARQALTELTVEVEKGVALVTGDPRLSFGDYLERWLENQSRQWTYRTTLAAQGSAKRVLPSLGNIKLSKLGEDDCRALLDELTAKYSVQTTRLAWYMVKRSLDDAVEDGLIAKHPMGRRLHPPIRRRTEVATMTKAQLDQVFAVSRGSRWHAVWVLMGLRGLRGGEMRGLKWSDINWQRGTLSIVRQGALQGAGQGMGLTSPKTAASTRIILLPSYCLRAVELHRAIQERDRQAAGDAWNDLDLVFCRKGDGGILYATHADYYWKRDLKAAGLPAIHLHALRHTAATLLAERGVSNVVIASILGHGSTRETDNTYTHMTRGLQQMGRDLIDEMFPVDEVE